MSLTPVHDRVLVCRIVGEVVAVGVGARNEDCRHLTMDVRAGARILFGKWSGPEIKRDGEGLSIMKESGILGIIA